MGRSRQRSGCARSTRGTGARIAGAVLLALAGWLPALLIPAPAEAGEGLPAQKSDALAVQGKADILVPLAAVPVVRISPAAAPPAAAPAQDDAATAAQEAATQEDDAAAAMDAADVPPADPGLASGGDVPLYLEVFINGQPTHLIGEFRRLPDGSFVSRAKELRELGLSPPQAAADDDLVSLKDLGATARYDEAAQRLDITVDDSHRLRKVYDLRGKSASRAWKEAKVRSTGLVVNYSLLASARADHFSSSTFEGASANFDAWVYSPLGTVFSSAFVRYDEFRTMKAVRLDSYWTWTDIDRAISWRIGDFITAGPSWARPVRMGGVRVSRNFRLRPDLVTTPLPSLSGSAAVPTTVDVYLNNIKVHSQRVDPGPFTITNIPAITSSGVARLVMRDATGRQIETRRSFYTSPQLMRAGMLEFSLSAGVPRHGHGETSFDYGHRPMGSGSLRYGVSDRLTIHGHAELAKDLQLGGIGASTVLFDKVLFSAAGAISHGPQGTGYLLSGGIETRFGNFSLNARTQRVFSRYADLATLTAAATATGLSGAVSTAGDFPRAMDSVSIGYALPDIAGGLSLNYLHVKSRSQGESHTLSLSYSQNLWRGINFYLTAFADIEHITRPGVFLGLSMPLGGATASTGFSYDKGGKYRATASYSRPLQQKNGSVGWRARVTYGDLRSAQASLAWRTSKATLRATAMQMEGRTLGHVMADGALIVAGGGLFASNRISDSFAIVDAGAPGVLVRYENRPVGRTDASGRILVPTLRSFERNKISIDPETLPVDALVEEDKTWVVPVNRSGVVVDFGVKTEAAAALVTFTDASGRFIEAGSEVSLEGAAEPFIVGYDGETWLEGLKEKNTVRITTGETTCEATFAYRPRPGEQVRIGPVTCR